jgi:hypothetical protein
LNEELFQYRSVIVQIFKYILKKAKEHYDKDEEYVVYFTEFVKGAAVEPLKLTREVLKYLRESPGVWLGFLICMFLGDYIPLTTDDNVFEWFFAWTARNSRRALNRVKPVRAFFRFFGLNLYHPEPELDIWEDMLWKLHNGMVGMKWGAMGQLVLDLLNKLFYRIELTARYKYPIPDGNVALDMIALSSNVAKMIAAGPTSVMLKQGGYKKKPKELMDKMLEMMDKLEQLKLESGKKKEKPAALPFPTHHALELKKPKPSADEQYNPNLTSGSEGDDELGDFVKRAKAMAKKKSTASSSGAKSSSGAGFKPPLKPIDERYVIGQAAPLPYQ